MKLKTVSTGLTPVSTHTVKVMPKQADAVYGTAEHRAWAKAVKKRAGWRCEFVDRRTGERCPCCAPKDRIIADHIVEVKDGGAPLDPANGQALCTRHNTAKGVAARASRHGLRGGVESLKP